MGEFTLKQNGTEMKIFTADYADLRRLLIAMPLVYF